MRWIVLFALTLAACQKDDPGPPVTRTDPQPGGAPVRTDVGSAAQANNGGGGSATVPKEAPGSGNEPAKKPPSGEDPVKVMTQLGDDICACKDQPCVEAIIQKSAGLQEKFASVTITPEMGKELEKIQRKVGGCMRKIQKGLTGPTDPRLTAPTKEDLAKYVKDVPGPATGKLMATITTSMGVFNCELYADKAPATVANFVGLATGKKAWKDPKTNAIMENKPYFNDLIFHRVIPGFMIQGGDPLGQGNGGPGYEFDDEVDNGLTVDPGCLAMANSGPATNGSQFFIMEGRAQWLDNKHTVFGKCAELDLVKKITGVEKECPTCGQQDPKAARPKTPVTIKTITFARK